MHPARPALLALALCLLVGAAGLPPAPAPAQGTVRTLSALQPLGGTVADAVIAGDAVVYRADFEVFGRFDLYSAPLAGGPIARLSAGLPPGTIAAFTPAGAYVVVELMPDSTDRYALYSVPLLGGPAVMLFPPTIDPADPASQPETAIADGWLVYRFDHAGAGAPQLFSAPLAGGPPIRLNMGQDGGVAALQVSADGGTVAYTLTPPGGPAQIYAVAPDGSDRALISGAPPPADPSADVALTPDGGAVVYVGASDPPGQQRLQQVERGGQIARTIAQHQTLTFHLARDGSRIIYEFSDSAPPAHGWRSAAIVGGDPVAMAVAEGLGAPVLIGPDGDDAYFLDGGILRRVPSDGGEALSVLSRWCTFDQVTFSENGDWLAFVCGGPDSYAYAYHTDYYGEAWEIDHSTAGFDDMWCCSLYDITGDYLVLSSSRGLRIVGLGGAPERTLQRDRSIAAVGAGHVVFTAGPTLTQRSLMHTTTTDDAVNQIDTAHAMVSDVRSFMLSPADGAALYLADQERMGLPELYRVPIAGGPAVRLNEPMYQDRSSYTEITQIFLAPAGGWVFYEVMHHSYTAYDSRSYTLWLAPIGGGTPTKIPVACDGMIRQKVVFSLDGTTAVIHCGPELFRVPLGGEPMTKIDTAGLPPLWPLAQISPDGAHVVYTSANAPRELRSAPLAGGAPVTLGPVTAGPFQISPDSRLVLYAQPIVGLVAQPVGGGPASPLPLLGPGETLGDWAITPDGAALVYTIRSAAGPALRRLPLAGGPAATLASAEAGSTIRFTLPPQTGRALYTVARPGAGPDAPPAHTLLSVPLAGGPPASLSGPFPSADFSLADVAVSPDGAFTAIRADAGLFAVATAGGAPARLDDPADLGAITAFAPTADGRVVFIEGGALLLSDRYGALRRRIDGAYPDRVAQAFELAGSSVVFLGETFLLREPTVNSVRELFAAELPPVASLLRVDGADLRLHEADRSPVIEVVLAAPQPRTVTVPYRVSGGTARAGVDYTLAAGPLVFAPGETHKRLPLTLLPRPGFQGRRTLSLSLTDPSPWANDAGETVAPAVVAVAITITDEAAALMLPMVGR